MKIYIVQASTTGTFDIPAGAYGWAIKPSLQLASAPDANYGPRFTGVPGQFPVSVRDLTGNTADLRALTNADTFYSELPLPGQRVSGCEPLSCWRLVVMDRAGETWREAESPTTALLEVGDVAFDGTFSTLDEEVPGIRVRPSYRSFVFHFKTQSDATGGTVRMFIRTASGVIYKAGEIDTLVEPIAVRSVLAPGGDLYLQADYVGTCHVEACVEIG